MPGFNYLVEKDLADEIILALKKKKSDLKRVINVELITLFWQVGKVINDSNVIPPYLKAGSREFYKRLYPLSLNYGPFFRTSSLKDMSRFAFGFTDLTGIQKFAPFIEWPHIVEILKIPDPDSQLNYINETVEKHLSLDELRKLIKRNIVDVKRQRATDRTKENQAKKKIEQIFLTGIEQIKKGKHISINFFKKPTISAFRKLLDYPTDSLSKAGLCCDTIPPDKCIDEIRRLVDAFKYKQHRWINSFLNICLWEAGNVINDKSRSGDRKFIFARNKNESKLRSEITGHLFYKASLFAKQFGDISHAARLANLVSWEHISLLLTLEDKKLQFYYAEISARKGLSPVQLKKIISKEIHSKGRRRRVSNVFGASVRTTTTKTRTIQKKGNNVFIIDKIEIDTGAAQPHINTINIFKNKYLDLVT